MSACVLGESSGSRQINNSSTLSNEAKLRRQCRCMQLFLFRFLHTLHFYFLFSIRALCRTDWLPSVWQQVKQHQRAGDLIDCNIGGGQVGGGVMCLLLLRSFGNQEKWCAPIQSFKSRTSQPFAQVTFNCYLQFIPMLLANQNAFTCHSGRSLVSLWMCVRVCFSFRSHSGSLFCSSVWVSWALQSFVFCCHLLLTLSLFIRLAIYSFICSMLQDGLFYFVVVAYKNTHLFGEMAWKV